MHGMSGPGVAHFGGPAMRMGGASVGTFARPEGQLRGSEDGLSRILVCVAIGLPATGGTAASTETLDMVGSSVAALPACTAWA